MRWAIAMVVGCALTGCGAFYCSAAEKAQGCMSVPARQDREWLARHEAERLRREHGEAERRKAVEAELAWRAEHPTEARQLDALHGIEDALRDGNRARPSHCTSTASFGAVQTNCY
jgi:hypothetical protein